MINSQLNKIKNLFFSSGRIIARQEEIKRLKGEDFNIFSILGIESSENKTHSAFLGELLNPRGSHLLGSVFLKLFLETIDFNSVFDYATATLIIEKHIGICDADLKTGGRIDIYLIDAQGNSISIENKINAGDQFAQIERYVNHNKENNTVYYLTLYGYEASEESAGLLKSGEHYYCVSYENTIVKWLEKCLKEATEYPILREMIKQYVILIKKLTNQLTDSKMEQEMIDLISKNYTEAKIIETNLRKVEVLIARDFLLSLKKRLIDQLNDENWIIEISKKLENNYEGFTMYNKNWIEHITIKLEGQSKIPYHNIVLGIRANKNEVKHEELKARLDVLKLPENGYPKGNDIWPFYEYVLYWRDEEKRAELFDCKKRILVEQDIFERILNLAKKCEDLLIKTAQKKN